MVEAKKESFTLHADMSHVSWLFVSASSAQAFYLVYICKRFTEIENGHTSKRKEYSELSVSQRNKLIKNIGEDEARDAYKKVLKTNGNLAGVKLVTTIEDKKQAKILLDNLSKSESKQLTPEQALGMLVSSGLTKNMYNIIRKTALDAGHDFLPSYKKVKSYWLLYQY